MLPNPIPFNHVLIDLAALKRMAGEDLYARIIRAREDARKEQLHADALQAYRDAPRRKVCIGPQDV